MVKAPTNKGNDKKVTRIKATDSTGAKVAKSKPATSAKQHKVVTAEQPVVTAKKNPFAGALRYFKGSWKELQQVRWPDRKNTWSMTGALLAFTAFLVIAILSLDYVFSLLFKLILGGE